MIVSIVWVGLARSRLNAAYMRSVVEGEGVKRLLTTRLRGIQLRSGQSLVGMYRAYLDGFEENVQSYIYIYIHMYIHIELKPSHPFGLATLECLLEGPKAARRGSKRWFDQLERWSTESLMHQCNRLLAP